jgi:hypothetical protein
MLFKIKLESTIEYLVDFFFMQNLKIRQFKSR